MSDEEHHFEAKGDAGASKTYPQQAGTIRKGGHLVIKGRPCKVLFVISYLIWFDVRSWANGVRIRDLCLLFTVGMIFWRIAEVDRKFGGVDGSPSEISVINWLILSQLDELIWFYLF